MVESQCAILHPLLFDEYHDAFLPNDDNTLEPTLELGRDKEFIVPIHIPDAKM